MTDDQLFFNARAQVNSLMALAQASGTRIACLNLQRKNFNAFARNIGHHQVADCRKYYDPYVDWIYDGIVTRLKPQD